MATLLRLFRDLDRVAFEQALGTWVRAQGLVFTGDAQFSQQALSRLVVRRGAAYF